MLYLQIHYFNLQLYKMDKIHNYFRPCHELTIMMPLQMSSFLNCVLSHFPLHIMNAYFVKWTFVESSYPFPESSYPFPEKWIGESDAAI